MTKRSRRGWKLQRRRLTAGPCWICATWCDPNLPIGHAKKATMDHIVPISLLPGQGYTAAGTRRACARCNSSRGARPAVAPLSAHPHPSRDW